MAGSDSHRQLLTLIRDYSTEKSQGERRILNGKKRIEELTSQLEASNKDLEEAKRVKEVAEQELKGYEVELSMIEASIQALEARVGLTTNEISKLGSELALLKNKENSLRDEFIANMLELNAKIRKFQELLASASNMENCSGTMVNGGEQDALQTSEFQEDKLAKLTSLANQEEQQYEAEKIVHDQIQQELATLEKKVKLRESVMKANMELQELSKQTQELEKQCAELGDELQKRFTCPNCHRDNSAMLGEILQISNES